MKFSEFLKEAKKESFWKSNRVVCFRSDTYPVAFLRRLFDYLKAKNILQSANLLNTDRLQLWKTLQQCFLGETSFYWLGDVVESVKKGRSRKKEPDIVEILSLYRGPHFISFFLHREHKTSTSTLKRMLVVDVPDQITETFLQPFFSFFDTKISKEKLEMVRHIVGGAHGASLDAVSVISDYLSVTSIRFADELKKNLSSIVHPELSLGELSHAFFRKKERSFFRLWAKCYNDYGVPFWTAYWGEQLWRAYNVVKFLKQNNFHAARRFSFRLPPSFIKGEWRACSLEELKKAYNMVYDIDFHFKKGSTFCSFDLFYSSYFLGKFA